MGTLSLYYVHSSWNHFSVTGGFYFLLNCDVRGLSALKGFDLDIEVVQLAHGVFGAPFQRPRH